VNVGDDCDAHAAAISPYFHGGRAARDALVIIIRGWAIAGSKGDTMANSFGTDILIQAPDPRTAAAFYVDHLGFKITAETPQMISLHGEHINLFIERGPSLGPVLEVTVESVDEAKHRLVKNGCEIIKEEPDFPRCYVKDPFGLIYNLTS
jgi:predicted enzyme related to lactoylglutathione lyase